ncbi:hypothetical protein HDV05_007024 [Chytridiales sp. JEL 0842]|nr:hypothetical protein HDV05_007024 [Chytridiales sp. JEL 0842]
MIITNLDAVLLLKTVTPNLWKACMSAFERTGKYPQSLLCTKRFVSSQLTAVQRQEVRAAFTDNKAFASTIRKSLAAYFQRYHQYLDTLHFAIKNAWRDLLEPLRFNIVVLVFAKIFPSFIDYIAAQRWNSTDRLSAELAHCIELQPEYVGLVARTPNVNADELVRFYSERVNQIRYYKEHPLHGNTVGIANFIISLELQRTSKAPTERETELKALLEQHGLILRPDSRLADNYIAGESCKDVEQVVAILKITSELFKYSHIAWSQLRGTYEFLLEHQALKGVYDADGKPAWIASAISITGTQSFANDCATARSYQNYPYDDYEGYGSDEDEYNLLIIDRNVVATNMSTPKSALSNALANSRKETGPIPTSIPGKTRKKDVLSTLFDQSEKEETLAFKNLAIDDGHEADDEDGRVGRVDSWLMAEQQDEIDQSARLKASSEYHNIWINHVPSSQDSSIALEQSTGRVYDWLENSQSQKRVDFGTGNDTTFDSDDEQGTEIAAEEHVEQALRDDAGLLIRYVTQDESCMFRAIALLLLGDEEKHGQVREECLAFMATHSRHYRNFIPDRFENYLNTMAHPQTRPTDLELQALADCYRINIDVYQDAINFTTITPCGRLPNSGRTVSDESIKLAIIGLNRYAALIVDDDHGEDNMVADHQDEDVDSELDDDLRQAIQLSLSEATPKSSNLLPKSNRTKTLLSQPIIIPSSPGEGSSQGPSSRKTHLSTFSRGNAYAASPGGSSIGSEEFNTLQAVLALSLQEAREKQKQRMQEGGNSESPRGSLGARGNYSYASAASPVVHRASLLRNSAGAGDRQQHPAMQRTGRSVTFAAGASHTVPRAKPGFLGMDNYDEDEALQMAIEMSKADVIQQQVQSQEPDESEPMVTSSKWKGKGRAL